MNRRFLYLVAALLWGIPGLIIAIKGIKAYTVMPANELWWLLLITAGVLVGFIMMFYRIVNRYCGFIAAEPEKTTIWHTFPLRGWILIVCMMGLGMALKFIPFIPEEFTASFYSGLGPALIVAAVLFIRKYVHSLK